MQHEIDIERAEAALQLALELSPNNAPAHHWYGVLLLRTGRVDDALIKFDEALELDPRSTIIHSMVGYGLQAAGRPHEAIAALERVIGIDPDFAVAYARIGVIYWTELGRLDEAVRWLAQGISHDPSNPSSYSDLGFVYLDLGDDVRAEEFINRSLEIAPGSQEGATALLSLHWYRRNVAQVVEVAQQLLLGNVRGAVAHSALWDIDVRAGRYAEARDRYKSAYPTLFEDDDPPIGIGNYDNAINLAHVLQRLGEANRAERLLDQYLSAIRSAEHDQMHLNKIRESQILALQGRTADALVFLRQAADTGWRFVHWYYLEHDPNLDSIRQEPEFRTITMEINADMSRQLARIKEMETSGKLALILPAD